MELIVIFIYNIYFSTYHTEWIFTSRNSCFFINSSSVSCRLCSESCADGGFPFFLNNLPNKPIFVGLLGIKWND